MRSIGLVRRCPAGEEVVKSKLTAMPMYVVAAATMIQYPR